jgi:poly(hydroxyalkanoate) granule-associated protein
MATARATTGYKKLQEDVFTGTRKVWLAGLGALSTVEEESTQLFEQLVEKGRGVEKRGRKQLKKARTELETTGEELTEKLDHKVSGVLQKIGVPSRTQVQDLTLRVEQLMEQVEKMTPARARKTTRRSTSIKAKKTTKA